VELHNHLLPCFFKQTTGIDCPGCGLQRAFLELINGNFIQSLELFPALIPLIFMFLFAFAHILLNFRHGAKIILYLFISNLLIIHIAYFLKLFH